MKEQKTMKFIKKLYGDNLIMVQYAELQTLLKYENPYFFTAGIYGWNADIYEIQTDEGYIGICTGYQPFGAVKPKSEMIKKYEKQAEQICHNNSNPKDEIYNLLQLFAIEAINA